MAALDASIEVVDPHFAELVGSGKLEQHWTGGAWTEGLKKTDSILTLSVLVGLCPLKH